MAICEFCGKEFEPKNNHRNYTQRFCGSTCARRANWQKKMAKCDQSQVKTCEYCGKEYIPKDLWRKDKYRFCSRTCSTKASWEDETRKEIQRQSKNRPLTPDTVHLVTMWHEQGDSPELIADILNRDIATINGILRGEIK